ncbi:hypothetical protein AB0L75_23965 [Streptomyces sp. NPDC052101]
MQLWVALHTPERAAAQALARRPLDAGVLDAPTGGAAYVLAAPCLVSSGR